MVQNDTAGAAAGFHATLLPLTARMAARITTDRRGVPASAPALADELLELIGRYVDETPIEKLDPRLGKIFALASLRALDHVERAAREQAKVRRRVVKRAKHNGDADDLVVIVDPEQQDLEDAGIPMPTSVPLHLIKRSELADPPEMRRGAYEPSPLSNCIAPKDAPRDDDAPTILVHRLDDAGNVVASRRQAVRL